MAADTMHTIPSFDLKRQNALLRDELAAAIAEVVASGHFILGPNVDALEQEVAALCGVKYGIGVANCSDALRIALVACGVGSGDEVITTPFTFIATAGSIVQVGARPVFCDIDPLTFNIDPEQIESKITNRTKAIMPVHLYGQPADMDPINEIAERYGLYVIEDAAQAIGASYRGRPVGSLGDIACISFFPTKNLGAFGDGGMIVTDNEDLANKVRLIRAHGSRKKYYAEIVGCNSRLDELQAAVLRLKLKYLEHWTCRRREIARLYNERLQGLEDADFGVPHEMDGVRHVFHQYTVTCGARDELQGYLGLRGMGSTVYYPWPLHLLPAFSGLGCSEGDYPMAEACAKTVLSLPMYPELAGEEAVRVTASVIEFVQGRGRTQ